MPKFHLTNLGHIEPDAKALMNKQIITSQANFPLCPHSHPHLYAALCLWCRLSREWWCSWWALDTLYGFFMKLFCWCKYINKDLKLNIKLDVCVCVFGNSDDSIDCHSTPELSIEWTMQARLKIWFSNWATNNLWKFNFALPHFQLN